MKRWILTQFFTGSSGALQPVCAAYGTKWHCPVLPSGTATWALVQMAITTQGIAAAATDSRVMVLPDITDPTPVPTMAVNAYAAPSGATAAFLQINTVGESITVAQLIHRLISVEPSYSHVLF